MQEPELGQGEVHASPKALLGGASNHIRNNQSWSEFAPGRGLGQSVVYDGGSLRVTELSSVDTRTVPLSSLRTGSDSNQGVGVGTGRGLCRP